jgi:hypothetical protein
MNNKNKDHTIDKGSADEGSADEGRATQPVRNKEEIQRSNINPKNARERKVADADRQRIDDADRHNGSGGAFEGTENPGHGD